MFTPIVVSGCSSATSPMGRSGRWSRAAIAMKDSYLGRDVRTSADGIVDLQRRPVSLLLRRFMNAEYFEKQRRDMLAAIRAISAHMAAEAGKTRQYRHSDIGWAASS